MPYILLATQLLIATIFLLSAGGKLLSTEAFVAALRLSLIPDAFIQPASDFLPWVELTVAGGLVLSPLQSLPLFMGVADLFLATFTA